MTGVQRIYPDVPCITSVSSYGRVSGEHSNDVEYVIDDNGRRWVIKRTMFGYNALLAEAIGVELSGALGIKTPSPALFLENGQHLWMTEQLHDVKHWSPDDCHLVTNLDSVGRMLALDVIVGNEDRHAGNILLQSTGDAFDAFSIDLEQSWAGTPDDISQREAYELPAIPRGFARLVPIGQLEAHMLAAGQLCESWTMQQLKALIQPWCNLLEEPRGDAIIEGLLSRARRATPLLRLRIDQFRGLQ